MRRSRAILLTVLFLLLAGIFAVAQQTDVSLNAIGVYSSTSTGLGIQQTATKSGGPLLSFRHFPSSHNGLEINYSYTNNTQRLTDKASGAVTGVQAGIHEITGAYVFHVTRGMFQPFALAGAGFLLMHPTDHARDTLVPDVRSQTRPTVLFGAGADIRVTKELAVRAQYRGLLYKAPDFFGENLALHTGQAMLTSEPSVGLVYRF